MHHTYLDLIPSQKNNLSQINETLLRNARISSILQKETKGGNKEIKKIEGKSE